MKNIILLLNLMLFCSCYSQGKITLRQMNNSLLKNKSLFPYSTSSDSTMIKMLTRGYTIYRLAGARSCNIDPDKKYSHIYIEDGFNAERGYYDGVIIFDNKDVCEVTANPNKLDIDSLSYIKGKEKDAIYNEVIFYTKKIEMENFKKNYLNEYFRYQLVIQNKTKEFEKCLNTDKYTPRSSIDLISYYFTKKYIEKNYIPFSYKDTFIEDGIKYLPYFKEEKKKEFINCISNLNIPIE
ncbi:hypothetical protein MP477_08445 [Chryseobacterium sp. WG23]|uniref:hypothetical protein n=1 Tax=Chryseobacterium sp. WG23 TaxID=2926910 RepID=UPI00211ED619|nr:hypothetical protein [Chryseobacterium sp. WG23]MCQ9634978.1 hypothetical protein [Chryseobacterium sp. WG23]